MTSAIRNQAVDEPVELPASYQFSRDDRNKLDEQVRGTQQAVIDTGLLDGPGTFYEIASTTTARAAGDVLCLTPNGNTAVLATAANLVDSPIILGMLLEPTQPSKRGLVRKFGVVSKSITGLAA